MRYNDPERIRQMLSIDYGRVRQIDDWIGDILRKPDTLGLTENTLVVFSSDHGEMLGDHGLHSKTIFREGSVHVPLMMRVPRAIKAGTVVSDRVSSRDVASAVLNYLGMPMPPSHGFRLRPRVEGRTRPRDMVA